MPLLSASNLSLYYGDLRVFSEVTLEVQPRAHIGVVGPNGGGKTSLLRVLIGELRPDSGRVDIERGARVGYVPQTVVSLTDGTLRDEIMVALEEVRSLEEELESHAASFHAEDEGEREQAQERYASLLARYEELGGYDYEGLVERVAAGVGLTESALGTPSEAASGGERTRAALARALLADPDLLVLDEPTNHLDFDALEWLESMLARSRHAVVVVSHDRYFLDRVAERIWEVESGRVQTFRGNFSQYRVQKAEQAARQRKEFEKQQELIAKEQWFIARYHAGQRGREARGRAKKLERLERVEAPQEQRTVTFHKGGAAAGRTGRIVLSTSGLKVGFQADGGAVQLLEAPDLEVERGSRTAIVGKNGSGKTTLLQTILGEVPALEGSVRLGHNVGVGYLWQELGDLPEGLDVLEAFRAARNMPEGEARAYLARFLFQGDDVFKPVSVLSGGERSRLALARLLVTAPNVLVLDEPTTHLDIPSREALEQVLQEYQGTLLFVSHDRQFVSLLAEQLWVIEGGGVRLFRGTFEEWTAQSSQQGRTSTRSTRRQRALSPERQAQRERERRERKAQEAEEGVLEVERRVRALEKELASSSQRQDVGAILRLSAEYSAAQAELERAWEEWQALLG